MTLTLWLRDGCRDTGGPGAGGRRLAVTDLDVVHHVEVRLLEAPDVGASLISGNGSAEVDRPRSAPGHHPHYDRAAVPTWTSWRRNRA